LISITSAEITLNYAESLLSIGDCKSHYSGWYCKDFYTARWYFWFV